MLGDCLAMDLNLERLRNTTLRALVAWTVAFGLLFQMMLPVVAQAKAQDPLAGPGVICALHADGADDHPSPPAGKDLDACCTICALLHAAKLWVPATAAPALLREPPTSSRLDHVADRPAHATAAPTPYCPRGPPPTI